MKTATQKKPSNQAFRRVLEKHFNARRKVNPNYSIRAFANLLKISSSALSAMLSGKRSITSEMCLRLGTGLGMSVEEIQRLVEGELDHTPIELSAFSVISDWHHYAILELMRTKGFKQDVRWIGQKLKISSTETLCAVNRLKEAGFIKTLDDGRWVEVGDTAKTNITGRTSSAGSRKLQKQILERAICALEELPIDVRDNTSITIAIKPEILSEVIQKIKVFRRSLASFIEEESEALGGPTEVYNLGIAFYPLTPVAEKGTP